MSEHADRGRDLRASALSIVERRKRGVEPRREGQGLNFGVARRRGAGAWYAPAADDDQSEGA